MSDKETEKEVRYLQEVYAKLLHQEEELTALLKTAKEEGIASIKSMAEDTSMNFDNMFDTMESLAAIESKNKEIDQLNIKVKTADTLLQKIKRLLQSPYFGKINVDFLDAEAPEDFYIGIHNFANDAGDNLIYDWRSPIAELFYNNALGNSYYSVQQRKIHVAINNRRQFIIAKDKLLKFFDTSIAIQDDVLLEALEHNATTHMKDITSTIQQEQNRIIRDQKNHIILVNGVAGSGKTSTIMQRIAYLLYSLRQEITVDNMLILSPNTNFVTYISNVLPALGEKNPTNLTFRELIQRQLADPLETEPQYFARISKETVDAQAVVLRSKAFIDHIKQVDELPLNDSFIRSITQNGKVIISKERIAAIYANAPAAPLKKVQAVKEALLDHWKKRLRTEAKSAAAQDLFLSLTEDQQQKYFGKLITADDEKSVLNYTQLLLARRYRKVTKAIQENKWLNSSKILEHLYSTYQKQPYQWQDPATFTVDEATALLAIRHFLIEKSHTPAIRFLLIDEVQDYTPAQICLLAELFPNSDFTMVGDENQAIFNTAISFAEITSCFSTRNTPIARYDLLNSYRSSGVITELFGQLAASTKRLTIVPVRPAGHPPQVFKIEDPRELIPLVGKLLEELQHEPLTIITKTSAEADKIAALFASDAEVSVLPISVSKGLEFSNVLVYDISADNYNTARDNRILYTAISRGMQRLFLTYAGEMTKSLHIE